MLWNLSKPILKFPHANTFLVFPRWEENDKVIDEENVDRQKEELELEGAEDSINYNYPVIVDVRRTSYSFISKEEEESVRHNHSLNYYKDSAAFYQHQHIIIIILQHKLTL